MDVDVKLIILFLFCRSKYKYLCESGVGNLIQELKINKCK